MENKNEYKVTLAQVAEYAIKQGWLRTDKIHWTTPEGMTVVAYSETGYGKVDSDFVHVRTQVQEV
jgi:hypothetical protein